MVYHPPQKKYQSCIINELGVSVQKLKADHPQYRIIIAGDFNELNDDEIKESTDLFQLVEQPTRQNSMLDRIYLSEIGPQGRVNAGRYTQQKKRYKELSRSLY